MFLAKLIDFSIFENYDQFRFDCLSDHFSSRSLIWVLQTDRIDAGRGGSLAAPEFAQKANETK